MRTVRVTYTCDKCGREINGNGERAYELNTFIYAPGENCPEDAESGAILCGPCYDRVDKVIQAVMKEGRYD